MLEVKLREVMENYNLKMILFVHPDLGIVQLTKDHTWYIHGRNYKNEVEKLQEEIDTQECDKKN